MRALFAGVLLWTGSAVAQEPAPTPESVELGIHPGLAVALRDSMGEAHVGPGVRVHLLKLMGPYFSLGAEGAVYANAGSSTTDNSSHLNSAVGGTLAQFGAVARLGANVRGVRPGLVAGVGLNAARDSTSLGFSMGMELEGRPVEWLPLCFDVRAHVAVADEEDRYKKPIFVVLGLGWRHRW